jgi:hypothetical protein
MVKKIFLLKSKTFTTLIENYLHRMIFDLNRMAFYVCIQIYFRIILVIS